MCLCQVWSKVRACAEILFLVRPIVSDVCVSQDQGGGGQDLLCLTQRPGNAWFMVSAQVRGNHLGPEHQLTQA